MTRDAMMWKPPRSRWAMICPAFREPRASGLMIARVRVPGMSGSYEFANDVTAREQSDERPAPDHRDAIDLLVRHDRCDLGERLIGRDAQHLSRHHVPHETSRCAGRGVDRSHAAAGCP